MKDNVSDAAVRRAIQRRQELEEEIRQIDLFLSLYERFAGQPVAVRNLPGTELQESGENEPGSPDDIAVGGGMTQKDFIELARELLLEIGRPVNGPGLLRKFHEKGRRIGGADEMKNLTTKVWRARDVIIKIPGAGYWPADVPCPAVSYVPPKNAKKEGAEE
ncbi:hypothetical protein [Defluviicoccus vanus]|uniref:HTH HARE-type domain-containing protein n=1 Tax=Defluviicoccus vanus TaxID=111831 RepID=A0A7H1N086_9PROT|nr:hypothetical protein [Defluviicoccus vanus]QNT69122.1 hypothetical protein HQ394_06885 [Defluviicoccus vanus]